MQRQLNPNLFGATTAQEVKLESDYRPMPPTVSEREIKEVKQSLRHLESQLGELAPQVRECLAGLREAQHKLDEANRSHNSRMDRLTAAIARVEQFQNQNLQTSNEKIADIYGKFNERRLADSKVESLLDRHSDTVQSFEIRLKQMQKMISDREMQILKTMNTLEDMRAELIRMKRL